MLEWGDTERVFVWGAEEANPKKQTHIYLGGEAKEHVMDCKLLFNPDNIKYINTMRQYCLDGQLVQTHFSDPVAAYDAALKIGDGGVGYLVEALAKVAPDARVKVFEQGDHNTILNMSIAATALVAFLAD